MVSHRWSGRWRVYWNSHSQAPHVWSIDKGDMNSEIKLETVTIQCACKTHVNLHADNEQEPKGWVEGIGEVRVYDGTAALVMGPGLVFNSGSLDRLTEQTVN